MPVIQEGIPIRRRGGNPLEAEMNTIIQEQFNSLYKQLVNSNDTSEDVDIDGKMYKKSSCIKIGMGYYLPDSKEIFKDFLFGTYHLKRNSNEIFTSIEISKGKVVTETSHCIPLTYSLCMKVYSKKHSFDGSVPNLECIKGWKCKEDINSNCYVDEEDCIISLEDCKGYEAYKNIAQQNPMCVGKIGDKTQSYLITEGIKYTFGIEMEVSRGNIPKWQAGRGLNISCVRDGSIDGGSAGCEFVTGVLVGDNGFKHLQEICNVLSSRTLVNKTCGKMYATL